MQRKRCIPRFIVAKIEYDRNNWQYFFCLFVLHCFNLLRIAQSVVRHHPNGHVFGGIRLVFESEKSNSNAKMIEQTFVDVAKPMLEIFLDGHDEFGRPLIEIVRLNLEQKQGVNERAKTSLRSKRFFSCKSLTPITTSMIGDAHSTGQPRPMRDARLFIPIMALN